jgi:hypothetical protein
MPLPSQYCPAFDTGVNGRILIFEHYGRKTMLGMP